MRITQVIGAVGPAFGGPAVGSVGLNKALRVQGVDARIVTTDLVSPSGSRSHEVVSQLSSGGARIIVGRAMPPTRFETSPAVWLRLWREVRRSDAVHIHGQYLPTPTIAALFAILMRKPYVIQAHGSLEPYQRANSRRRKRVFHALIGRHVIGRASLIQFASDSECERASDIVRPDQVSIVPLGAALEEPETVRSVAEFLGDIEREKAVLFLGRLARKKRPDALIEAWRAAKERGAEGKLVIAGSDGEWTRQDLQQLVDAAGLEETVLIVGPVTRAEASWCFLRCGVFALPSENENFGISVAEAMLGGMHVVTTDEVAASVHLLASGGGAVYHDAHELEELLLDALSDEAYVRRSGRAAREYAESNLTWAAVAHNVAAKLGEVGVD
ncbi:glycosyltransferase [Demequina zhanjiangensis]|uniref:D-inositol 3-phosphate glycosyltransferase n=1 Tax=Demequina zhanjiangensis TaxID=3051659 RepID=A0ABT8FYP0_9MICO|nr:glycosyltransferase [Demequina sp. SYSU T00b26]MDN4472020.1 glycosyltransferase [Demequina sp. SYSU T00b26]